MRHSASIHLNEAAGDVEAGTSLLTQSEYTDLVELTAQGLDKGRDVFIYSFTIVYE